MKKDRGSGDFRSPVRDIRHDDEGIGQTLEIYLKDEEAGIFVKLFYGVLPDCDVITRAVSVTNIPVSRLAAVGKLQVISIIQ